MKKIWLIPMCAILLCIMLASCSYEIPELSRDEAESIALSYFADVHGKDAEVSFWERVQVKEDLSVWFIHVEIDEERYELVLDENDEPLADNYLCLNLIREVEAAVFYQWPKNCSVSFSAYLNYDKGKYEPSCLVSTRQLPDEELRDACFVFLRLLESCGVDRMCFQVCSPDFLLRGPGWNSYQLAAAIFSSELSEREFADRYSELMGSIDWEEDVFWGLIQQLSSLGYQNVDLYISEYKVDSLVIEVYCEPGTAESMDAAVREVEAIPEDALSVEGKTIRYRLNTEK